MKKPNKPAQGLIEYVLLFLIVLAALWFFMGPYIRNAISGRWRESGDSIGQAEVYLPGTTVPSQDIRNTKGP